MEKEKFSKSPTKASRSFAWPYRGELPIITYCPVPFKPNDNRDETNDDGTPKTEPITETERRQIYDSVRECGFNTVMILGNETPESGQMPPESDDINIIMANGALFASAGTCYEALLDYMGNPNIVAWNIHDEPNPASWGDVFYSFDKASGYNQETLWNQLTIGYEMASSIDPTRLVMFNLAVATSKIWIGSFGGWGLPVSAAITRYRAYLDNLNTLYKCPIWSYDYYPIRNELKDNPLVEGQKEVLEGQYDIEYDTFFTYLGIFQDFTESTNSKFWAFGLCYAHKLYNNNNWKKMDVSFPMATEGMLRFEVFAALLYGAQGISYYRYGLGRQKEHITITKHISGSESTKYTSNQENIMAPLSFRKNGDVFTLEKSVMWYNVKKINEEIKAFQNIFLGCTVTGHMQFSSELPSRNPQSSKYYIDSIQSFKGDTKDIKTSIRMISCDGYGVLLTSFTNNTGANGKTRHYVAVMNLDPINQKDVSFYLRKGTLHPVHHLVRPSITPGHPTAFEQSLPTINVRYDVTLKEGGLFVVYWDE